MKSEQIEIRSDTVVVLDVQLDNFYAFRNFHVNLTYPKKIVGSSIENEHLAGRPNFRYKKVNIIMGANATGKTTFGRMLMKIFNFIDKLNYKLITDVIDDCKKSAFFALDIASRNVLYRIMCYISPRADENYTPDDIKLEIRQEKILAKDSYESCAKRIAEQDYTAEESFVEELQKMGELDWLFEYPSDTRRVLRLPAKNEKFSFILESVLRALDPSICKVEMSQDVSDAYVIRLRERSVIIQNNEEFDTKLLSSGTIAGVEIACFISALLHNKHTFYYCDEKFPYIHSDIEKAVLSLMIECLRPNDQLFFTTHNTDVLDMDLPKHAFSFLRKNVDNEECPITCIEASSLLKRSTDSLKNAVENDLFSCAPAVDFIYAIADR